MEPEERELRALLDGSPRTTITVVRLFPNEFEFEVDHIQIDGTYGLAYDVYEVVVRSDSTNVRMFMTGENCKRLANVLRRATEEK